REIQITHPAESENISKFSTRTNFRIASDIEAAKEANTMSVKKLTKEIKQLTGAEQVTEAKAITEVEQVKKAEQVPKSEQMTEAELVTVVKQVTEFEQVTEA
ncbi:unnamed protein product, partial [Lymnaea stagnalis]